MRIMKILGIGFVVLIAVFVLLSGCVGVVMPIEEGSEEGIEDKKIEEVGKENKNESKEKELLGVGDSYTIDGVTVTVNGVEYTDERNQFYEGHVDSVILVNVTYENNTGDDIAVGMDFQLYADGEKMDTYPVDSLLGSVSDGRTVTGNIAYGIVGQPKKIELEFEPIFSISGDKGIYDITP